MRLSLNALARLSAFISASDLCGLIGSFFAVIWAFLRLIYENKQTIGKRGVTGKKNYYSLPGNPRILVWSRRGSSVVERVIGNDEVGSSILPHSTILITIIMDVCRLQSVTAVWSLLCNVLGVLGVATELGQVIIPRRSVERK